MNPGKIKHIALGIALISALGGAYSAGHLASSVPTVAVAAAASPVPATTVALPSALPDMGSIVERNGQAVVNISVSGSRKTSALPELDRDDPFYDFFRRFGGQLPQNNAPMRGQGSGFIVSADGTILTNAHVVDGADEVTVKLTDKREFRAKVRGMDKASDVAVLKIEASNLPTVRIGNPSGTRVGDWVLAIGSPFGFENSASAGIVSAKGRSLPDGSYVPFIQTDVAVNPGNSGGPLFNMTGEVIGINAQIYSRSGGYQGLSFAIPIDVAMNVERQIVATGKVQRGKLGVTIQAIDQSLAESFGLAKPSGALVSAVEKGSPADKAGVVPGDVILSLNGRDIASSSELPALVAGMAPGENAKLSLWRHGAPRQIEVHIGTFADDKVAAAEPAGKPSSRLGVSVRPLTPDEQRSAEVKGGLLVNDADGAAARAGIQPGDIILSVNGNAVQTPEQLRSVLAKSGKRAAILISREDRRLFVPVDLG